MIAFTTSIGVLGGTAANGRVVEGQHFLGEHGRYVPVSPETYGLSERITLAAGVGWLVGSVGLLMLKKYPDPPFEFWVVAVAALGMIGLVIFWVCTAVGLRSPVASGLALAVCGAGLLATVSGRRR